MELEEQHRAVRSELESALRRQLESDEAAKRSYETEAGLLASELAASVQAQAELRYAIEEKGSAATARGGTRRGANFGLNEERRFERYTGLVGSEKE